MSVKIANLYGRIIKDSKNEKTIEVELLTDSDKKFISSCPSGESRGSKEAALVDPDVGVENINNNIATELIDYEFEDIKELDNKLLDLDGTENKSKLGANAILPISISAIKALADSNNKQLWKFISEYINCQPSLPMPMMVMIEGGKHSYYKGVKWQEYLLNSDDIENGTKFLKLLKNYLENNKIAFQQGFEGGYSIDAKTSQEALDIFLEILSQINQNLTFSLDIAATHFCISNDEINQLITIPALATIEDPAQEEEWDSWKNIVDKYGDKKKFIGDDLIVTNYNCLKKAIELKACQGLIIKPNQIGTVSQTLQVAKLATEANLIKIVSHRAKDTKDDFIADLAVGIGAQYIKSGAPTQPERIAKYNRLEKIKQNFEV